MLRVKRKNGDILNTINHIYKTDKPASSEHMNLFNNKSTKKVVFNNIKNWNCNSPVSENY